MWMCLTDQSVPTNFFIENVVVQTDVVGGKEKEIVKNGCKLSRCGLN